MSETTPKTNGLRWDGVVTAGNVLTAAAMVMALVVWGLRLEGRVDAQHERAMRLEAAQARDEADKARMSDALTRLQADQVATLRTVSRIEMILDRGSLPPPPR